MLMSVHKTESFPHAECVPSLYNYCNICEILKRKMEICELLENFLDSSPKPHREEDGLEQRGGFLLAQAQLSFGTIIPGLRQRM